MQDFVLPQDDGSIERALAELDGKLSAWTTAMLDAQAAMRTAESAVRQTPPEVEPEAANAAGPQVAESVAIAPVIEAAAQPTPADEPVAEPEPQQRSPAASADVPPVVPEAPGAAAQVDPAPSPAETAGQLSRQSQDEALLATLDEETAKAIRIMRRLDFGRRSVAELLEEYRATQATAKSTPAKSKSWWSRGKG